MSRSIGELESEVLHLLQKSPGYSGYYSDEKLRMAVRDCFDFVSGMMFEGESGGWLDDITYKDTTAGQAVVQLDADIVMIKVVRYKVNSLYIPLYYDKEERNAQTDASDGNNQGPIRYRMVGNAFYFNPPLQEGGSKYLQIECTRYPKNFSSKNDAIMPQFIRCFQHYIKFRCASILSAAKQDPAPPPWRPYELEWKDQVVKLIGRRINDVTTIAEYEG